MSYRTLYLVCYDISSPRRLYRVHHFLQGFRVGGQKSFFECWLNPLELKEVESRLVEMMDLSEDRVHIFQMDPRMQPECHGKAISKPLNSPFFLI
ncbi:CRISPR-associated endonuclease Cas2 [Ferrovum myxofaciens]|uniref:CRISPR-associated endonuclease Cas2 n=1 Tax=Ferrovum myxofaciens TaxID=416213 RepID=UPI0007817B98|nr:CRISPR-associated endonuclease Cas2 [Ferrovum myxofaciens]